MKKYIYDEIAIKAVMNILNSLKVEGMNIMKRRENWNGTNRTSLKANTKVRFRISWTIS